MENPSTKQETRQAISELENTLTSQLNEIDRIIQELRNHNGPVRSACILENKPAPRQSVYEHELVSVALSDAQRFRDALNRWGQDHLRNLRNLVPGLPD